MVKELLVGYQTASYTCLMYDQCSCKSILHFLALSKNVIFNFFRLLLGKFTHLQLNTVLCKHAVNGNAPGNNAMHSA